MPRPEDWPTRYLHTQPVKSALLWFRARVLGSTAAHLQRAEHLVGRCLQAGRNDIQHQQQLVRSLHAIASVERHLARQYWSRRCDADSVRLHAEALARIRSRLSAQPQAQGVAQTLKAVCNRCPEHARYMELEELCRDLRPPETLHQPRG